MKTTNLLSIGMVKIIMVCILIFSNFSINAQTPTKTLSSQEDVDSYKVIDVIGNLIIDDDGSGSPIVDLDILINTLRTVSGSLTVTGNPSLPHLEGLDGITSIGEWFNITNNPSLTTLGQYNFALTSLKNLNIGNCPSLNNISRLSNLTTVAAFLFGGNLAISDFTVFNSVTNCDLVQFYLSNISSINGFDGITSNSFIFIGNNSNLVSISGFNNLTNMKLGNVVDADRNTFYIGANNNLSSISGFSSLKTVAGTAINISSNPLLSTCCFATKVLTSNPGSVVISGNASGCNSVAQINAPPTLTTCPPHQTISTSPGSCTGSTSAISPTSFDNCDLDSYNVSVLLPDGQVQNTFNIPNNTSRTYNNLIKGINKVTYIATDDNGNIATCFFNVTVEDNEKPIMSNIPPDVTINCFDNFPSIPSPIISDNCDAGPVLTIASSLAVGNCTVGTPAEIQSYSWTLTDNSGNVTTADWEVTVISDFSFDLGPPIEICDESSYLLKPGVSGNTYSWSTGATSQNISISVSGTYELTVTTSNGCCYVDEIMVTFSSPPDATAMGGSLNCSAENVQIFGSSTGSGVTYAWTGPGSFTSDMQNPLVTSVGDYILTVSNAAGCSSTTMTTVTGDTDIPDVTADGGTIDCASNTVQIMGSSASSGVTYSWTGPDGYTSDMQNPTVSVPGIYSLNVLSDDGCTGRADANVIDNTAPPEIMLAPDTLTCTLSELDLSVSGSASWTGPEGFTSTDEIITVTAPGTYAVTVTGSNSCTNSVSVEISSDVEEPNISAEGGIINCLSGQSIISGNSTSEGATYSWSGPGGFTTEIQNPIAIVAGTYTLVVTGANGCTASQDVEVAPDMDAPEISVNDGSIDCINTSATLTATSASAGVNFMWIGPNSFTSEEPIITVMEPGEYTAMAINENGCAGIATSQVVANNAEPTVSIFVAPLGCQLNDVNFLTEVSEGIATFSWSGPNGFTSNEKAPVITDIGSYMLEVIGENGCSAMATFEVVSDAEVPDASASVEGILTCTQNTTTLIGSTTTDTVTFSWTGPDDYTSDLQNPTVSQPGTYVFYVTAANGCAGQASVEVLGDGNLPTVTATGGAIDCTNSSVMLLGATNLEDASVKWEGPNGFATSINNPEVDIAGEYTFTVTTDGGCVAFKTVNVSVDNQDPNLSLSEGFLNCDAGERDFRVITNANDPVVLWTGPNDYNSSELSATYSKAGNYTLLVTGSNGCSSQLSIEVEFDVSYVHTLNITGNDASLEIEGGTPPFEITWDNNISGSEIKDLADGEHFVKIVDGLECTKFVEFLINTTSTIDIEEALDLKIYPNPALNEVKVEWKSTDFQPKNLEILSTNGRKILQTEIAGKNSQLLNLNDITPGVYFIKIEGKDAVVFKKFLKM